MKYGLEDTGGATELGQMQDSISNPLEALGKDSFLPLDHPCWLRAMKLAAALFTSGSFVDPNLPGWCEFLYAVVPLLEE